MDHERRKQPCPSLIAGIAIFFTSGPLLMLLSRHLLCWLFGFALLFRFAANQADLHESGGAFVAQLRKFPFR